MNLAERAAVGATWLDRGRPGWWRQIDLVKFDIADCYRCIIGQLYGNYCCAVTNDSAWNVAHGFSLSCAEDDQHNWKQLQEAWLQEIQQRREKAVCTVC